ncbi:MAG: hypothetical protein GF332_02140 [Candidatus Moranbacteria bacterium]|nr:hypothetical protein [Candidatus Moranbacteria bacterium]
MTKKARKLIDFWKLGVNGRLNQAALLKQLRRHYPPFLSVRMTRHCILNCQHCLYPKANVKDFDRVNLRRIGLVIQSAAKVGIKHLIYTGRVLKKRHLDLLKKAQDLGMKLYLIDNGSAAKLLEDIRQKGLFFDGGIDISIDGDKQTHEKQRGPNSFNLAIQGAKKLREAGSGISVTATASSINYQSITRGLVKLRGQLPFVKVWQLATTVSFAHHKKRMNLNKQEMKTLFANFKKFVQKYDLTLAIYQNNDMEPILKDLNKIGKPEFKYISMFWSLGKGKVKYFPESIVVSEEIPIDADGTHYLPFKADYHLGERPAEYASDSDLIIRDPDKSYEALVQKHWETQGKYKFEQEKRMFGKLKNIVNS